MGTEGRSRATLPQFPWTCFCSKICNSETAYRRHVKGGREACARHRFRIGNTSTLQAPEDIANEYNGAESEGENQDMDLDQPEVLPLTEPDPSVHAPPLPSLPGHPTRTNHHLPIPSRQAAFLAAPSQPLPPSPSPGSQAPFSPCSPPHSPAHASPPHSLQRQSSQPSAGAHTVTAAQQPHGSVDGGPPPPSPAPLQVEHQVEDDNQQDAPEAEAESEPEEYALFDDDDDDIEQLTATPHHDVGLGFFVPSREPSQAGSAPGSPPSTPRSTASPSVSEGTPSGPSSATPPGSQPPSSPSSSDSGSLSPSSDAGIHAEEDAYDSQGRRTAEFYLRRLHLPLYEGQARNLTLLEHCYVVAKEKTDFRQNDVACDRSLRYYAEVVLPPGNLSPPSLHILKRCLRVDDSSKYEEHVCVNDCCRFSKLQPHEYADHQDEKCRKCGQARFFVRRVAGGHVYKPRKVFWNFGLVNTIDRLFADPEFCKHRAADRVNEQLQVTDFYKSPEARRIDAATNGAVVDVRNSVYEVCFDSCQTFTFRQWSVGIMGIRCLDLPPHIRNKKRFTLPLVVIPGPKEPKSITPYLEPTLQEWSSFGPGGTEAMRVAKSKLLAFSNNAAEQGGKATHRPILSGMSGDGPGLVKFSMHLSHAAYLGCGFCQLQGTRIAADGSVVHMHFTGYLQDIIAGLRVHGLEHLLVYGRAGSLEIAMTHDAQKQRALKVERHLKKQPGFEDWKPNDAGCHGVSPLILALPYLDYNNTFLVPVAHAGLLGVLKNFWAKVLQKQARGQERPPWVMPPEVRQVIASRAADMFMTCDFSRPYRCIINNRGNWVMEDYMNLLDTFAVYLLRPIPRQGQAAQSVFGHMPVLEQMWQHLRAGLLFYLRPYEEEPTDGTDAERWERYEVACEAAKEAMLAYACLAEEHFGHDLCTYTLHSLICRLPRQQLQCGHAAFYLEMYVERLMQAAKRTTKFRTTGAPEPVIVNEMLWRHALDRSKSSHPHLRTFDEMVPAWGGDPDMVKGHWLDDVLAGEGLLGSGARVVGGQQQQECQDLFERYAAEFFEDAQLVRADLGEDPYLVVRYKRAHRAGVEILHSTSYERPRSRASYFVRVRYQEEDGEVLYVAKIHYFLGFGNLQQLVDNGVDLPSERAVSLHFRCAVADLFKGTTRSGFMGDIIEVADITSPRHSAYPVKLAHVDCKVMYCKATEGNGKKAFFVPYTHAPWDNA